MILQRLKELADRVREELPPPGYAPMKIGWIIKLDQEGKLLGAIQTAPPEGKVRFIERNAPNPNLTGKRAVNIKAGLLADSAEYALGIPSAKKEAKPARLKQQHATFLETVDIAAEKLHLPAIRAVSEFLHKDGVSTLPGLSEIDGGDWVTFKVDGVLPIDLPEVQAYWTDLADAELKAKGSCLVCGRDNLPLVDLQPVALKSIPGGQSAGVMMISANCEPFESYGLKSAQIAPMCRPCAEDTHNVINHLNSKEQHRYRLSDKALFLFWTREEAPFSMAALLNNPEPETVKKLFAAPYSATSSARYIDANRFYCLALSGSGGRAVVRDWIEAVVPEVQSHLANFFKAQRIVGGKTEYVKLYFLAGATVRDLDQLAPWVPITLFEYALKGTLLPEALLTTVVRRCGVGKTDLQKNRYHTDHAQAALVKMCLISNHARKGEILSEDWMVKLDLNCDSPAYLYGRLFNVLEQIQHEASGGDSVERTFGTAVMSPVSTLPRLTARAKQAHLPKLRRDKGAAYVRYEKLLNEIIGQLGAEHAFLTKLNAEEQGLFILGYYHQNARRWEEIQTATVNKAARDNQDSTLSLEE